jgi:hypothetical protein
MLNRRQLMPLIPALGLQLRAASPQWTLCIHQTTSVAAGFRKSLEDHARAGIRNVRAASGIQARIG